MPYQDSLNALLHDPTFRNTAGEEIFLNAKIIKNIGKHAFHSKRGIYPSEPIFYVFAIPVRLILECGGNML